VRRFRTPFRRRASLLAAGLVAASALAAPGPLRGQAGPGIRGTVVDGDTGAAVPEASVVLQGTGLLGITDEEGRFELPALEPGAYRLIVFHPGFRDGTAELRVEAGRTAVVEIRLERIVFEMAGLVVTANRRETRPEDAPVSISVMTGDEIARRNVVSLDEALPYAQGVIFNAGQLDIRGATGLARGVGSRVLMLLDGHRVLSGVGASIDFEALPVLDVDRVEIVKGPHSTLFGSNALGGVVNVLTKRPPANPETTARAYYGFHDTPSRYRFTDETLAMEGLGLQHSRRIGEVGTTLFVGREHADGFRENGKQERWQARIKTVFPAESANPWEIFASYSREDEEEFFTWLSADRPLEVDPTERGDWARQEDLVIGLTANPIVRPDLTLRVQPHLYHSRVQNHYHDNEDYHRSTRYGTDVLLCIYPTREHAVTVGSEASYTPVTSNFLGDGDPRVADLALFAQDEVRLTDRLSGSVGVRLDYHKASSSERDVVLNPKVGVVFQPSDRLSLRASLSRGYRAPSVSEQFTQTTVFGFSVIPNYALKGETAWAGEVGATARLGERVWLDAGLFWSEYSDLIEPGQAPGQFFVFQFRNVAEATVRGLDTGLRVSLIPDALSLNANYVFLDTEDARTGKALPYRSMHNLTTGLSAWHGLAAVDVRYRSRVDEVLAFPLDSRGSITVVDVRVGYRILGAVVQAKVENLFQNSYVDVQERSPGQTRTFRLTVTPRF